MNTSPDRASAVAPISSPATAAFGAPPSRRRELLDRGWRFRLGDESAALAAVDCMEARIDWRQYAEPTTFAMRSPDPAEADSGWRPVDLPHDWSLELPYDSKPALAKLGFLPESVGFYRRLFALGSDEEGRKVYLEFDGVFRDCQMWFNGERMARHESGYTGFRVDVTELALRRRGPELRLRAGGPAGARVLVGGRLRHLPACLAGDDGPPGFRARRRVCEHVRGDRGGGDGAGDSHGL
jgi:hypothetical protein